MLHLHFFRLMNHTVTMVVGLFRMHIDIILISDLCELFIIRYLIVSGVDVNCLLLQRCCLTMFFKLRNSFISFDDFFILNILIMVYQSMFVIWDIASLDILIHHRSHFLWISHVNTQLFKPYHSVGRMYFLFFGWRGSELSWNIYRIDFWPRLSIFQQFVFALTPQMRFKNVYFGDGFCISKLNFRTLRPK